MKKYCKGCDHKHPHQKKDPCLTYGHRWSKGVLLLLIQPVYPDKITHSTRPAQESRGNDQEHDQKICSLPHRTPIAVADRNHKDDHVLPLIQGTEKAIVAFPKGGQPLHCLFRPFRIQTKRLVLIHLHRAGQHIRSDPERLRGISFCSIEGGKEQREICQLIMNLPIRILPAKPEDTHLERILDLPEGLFLLILHFRKRTVFIRFPFDEIY